MFCVPLNKHIDGLASKLHNFYIPETDFIALLDRYNHLAKCAKITFKSKY